MSLTIKGKLSLIWDMIILSILQLFPLIWWKILFTLAGSGGIRVLWTYLSIFSSSTCLLIVMEHNKTFPHSFLYVTGIHLFF